MSEQETPAIPEILQPGIGDYVAAGRAQTAQQRSTAAQNRVATGDSELAALGAGTDPEFVTTLEHFEGWTHQAMYEAVHGAGGMDAAGLRTLQRVWRENYSDLVNLSTFNLLGMNRIFGEGLWTGDSADAAQAAAERYSAVANQIGRVFGSVANRLDALAWAAEALRAAVQPPPNTAVVQIDPDDPTQSVLPGLMSPEYADQARAAQEVARQEAVRALNNIYKPTYPPAGSGVPTYVMVPQIGGDTPGTPAGTSPSPPGSPGAAPVTPDDGTPPQQNPVAPGGENPLALDPEQLGALEGLLPDTGEVPGGDPAATTPAGVTPSSTATPGGPGAPGPGTQSPGPSSPEPPGRTVNGPGGPGTAAVPPAAAAAAGPRGGASPGRGSMMPAMPGAAGAGRRGENDDEHSAPDYLRRVHDDWTEGLGSPVGVIGADPADETLPASRASVPRSELYDGFGSEFGNEPTSPAAHGSAGTTGTPLPNRTGSPEPALPGTNPSTRAPSSGAPGRAPRSGPVGWAPGTSPAHHAPSTSPAHHAPSTSPAHHAPSTSPAHHAPDEQMSGSGPAGQEPPVRNISPSPPPAIPAEGRSEPSPTTDTVVFTATGSGPIMDESAAGNSPAPEPEIFTVTGSGPIMDIENPGGAPPR
ncbi:hypothetical protein [Nocardia sp. X0981]